MSAVLKLFRLQIDEKYDIFKVKDIKKWLWTITKYLTLLAAITLGCFMFLNKIMSLGIIVDENILSIVLLCIQMLSLFFAIGHVVTELFLSRDNELLLCMPVTPNNLFLSKIMLIYVQEVIVSSFYTIPLLLCLGFFGLSSALFYIMIPVMLFLLPLLPLSLAFVLAIPSVTILKFLKNHLIVSIMLILGLVCLLLWAYTTFLIDAIGAFNITSKQIEMVININKGIANWSKNTFIYIQLALSMIVISKIYWVAIFLAICFTLFTLGSLIIKPFYFKSMIETSTKETKKQKVFKKEHAFISLLKKEILTVLRSPNYIFQYFIFTFLMPIIVFAYDQLLLTLVVSQTGVTLVAAAHLLIVSIMATLSNVVSATALSREGGNFYLMKTMPVNYYTQSLAKLTFNMIFTMGALVLTTIISAFYLPISTVLLTYTVVSLISIAHILISFEFDLKNPTLDWYDSNEVTQLNKNTTLSILRGLSLSLMSAVFITFFAGSKNMFFPWLILITLASALVARRARILYLRISYKYDRLEW